MGVVFMEASIDLVQFLEGCLVSCHSIPPLVGRTQVAIESSGPFRKYTEAKQFKRLGEFWSNDCPTILLCYVTRVALKKISPFMHRQCIIDLLVRFYSVKYSIQLYFLIGYVYIYYPSNFDPLPSQHKFRPTV